MSIAKPENEGISKDVECILEEQGINYNPAVETKLADVTPNYAAKDFEKQSSPVKIYEEYNMIISALMTNAKPSNAKAIAESAENSNPVRLNRKPTAKVYPEPLPSSAKKRKLDEGDDAEGGISDDDDDDYFVVID